jgi:hypothetical protein
LRKERQSYAEYNWNLESVWMHTWGRLTSEMDIFSELRMQLKEEQVTSMH